MLNVLVTSLFMVSYVGSNGTMFPNVSARIAAVAGTSVELFCGSVDGSKVQFWDHYSPASNDGSQSWIKTRIYNGVDIRPEFKPNIEWKRSDEGKWILRITLVNTSNYGYYKCVRSEHITNNTISTSNGVTSELFVFDSDPQCNISQDVFKNGDYIELWCNLKYFGSMAPVMKWIKNGIEPYATIRDAIIYNATHSELTSKLCVKAIYSLHNSTFSCKCYFEQSCNQAGSSECMVPDYQYTWTSPILQVKYHPRYIDIVPEKKIFHPGETISCSADGYPPPDYKWRNLEGNSSEIGSGSVLTITIEMIRDTEYSYECSASNSNDDMGIRRNITFTVKASFAILTSTAISIGTVCILLLFAILVVNLDMQRRCRERQRRSEKTANVKREPDDSYSHTSLRDDCVPSVNVEGVSFSSESNAAYDEIRELTETEGAASDPSSLPAHSDGCYMELHGRDPEIPAVYTSLEETMH